MVTKDHEVTGGQSAKGELIAHKKQCRHCKAGSENTLPGWTNAYDRLLNVTCIRIVSSLTPHSDI